MNKLLGEDGRKRIDSIVVRDLGEFIERLQAEGLPVEKRNHVQIADVFGIKIIASRYVPSGSILVKSNMCIKCGRSVNDGRCYRGLWHTPEVQVVEYGKESD